MPFQPAADERAERTNVEASRSRVVERISCDLRAHSLTFIPLGYLGVKKNDGVGCELVFRYTSERAVNPGLEAGVCRIVDDRHTHVAHCARGRAVSGQKQGRARSGQGIEHVKACDSRQGAGATRAAADASPRRCRGLRWAHVPGLTSMTDVIASRSSACRVVCTTRTLHIAWVTTSPGTEPSI